MKYFFLILLFSNSASLFSKQKRAEFIVLDTADRPIEGVTITLEWNNSYGGRTIRTKLMTNAKGHAQFYFRHNPVNYRFHFNKKGYFTEQEGPHGKGGYSHLFNKNEPNKIIEQWMCPRVKIDPMSISEDLVGITVEEFLNFFKISNREYHIHWRGYYKGYSIYSNRWGQISRSLSIETEDSLSIILTYADDTLTNNHYDSIKRNKIRSIGICSPNCSIKIYGNKDSLSFPRNNHCKY